MGKEAGATPAYAARTPRVDRQAAEVHGGLDRQPGAPIKIVEQGKDGS